MELFPVLMVVLFLAVAFFAQWATHNGRVNTLRELARNLEGGRVSVDTGFFASLNGASVRGRLDGHNVSATFEVRGHGKHKTTYVTLRAGVSKPVARFSVKQAGMLNKLGRWLGVLKHVDTGNKRVDAKYVLNGRAADLKDLFRHRGAEQSLDRIFESGHSEVVLTGTGLKTEGRYHGRGASALAQNLSSMVRLAKLCDRKEVRIKVLGEAIKFAWTGGGSDALCPYCRDGIDPDGIDLVACERCNTVHHRECLDEAGGCTIFGCEGGKTRGRPQRVR